MICNDLVKFPVLNTHLKDTFLFFKNNTEAPHRDMLD